MSQLPNYRPQNAPEGKYSFKVVSAELKKKTVERGAKTYDVNFVAFRFQALGSNGNYTVFDNMFSHEDRYKDILLVAGMDPENPGDTQELIGVTFGAFLSHEADKKDPSKTWSRVGSIETPEKPLESGPRDPEDEIPF
jgi:hypothetical protein